MASPVPLPQIVVQHAATLYRQGIGLEPLSERLGTNWRTLRRALENAGVPIRPQGAPAEPYTPTERDAMRRLYLRGASLKYLAKRFGGSWQRIKAALCASGVAIRAPKWPEQERGVTRVLVPYEDRLAKGLAEETKREAAEIALLDRRCECGGILRQGIPHRCRA